MLRYLLVALTIGCLAAAVCGRYQAQFGRGAGDLTWPRCGARALLAGSEPYRCDHRMSNGLPGPSNPLTAAIAVLPLAWLPPMAMASAFFGLSSALLAWSLLRANGWWGLAVFLALPYWHALITVQWAPLLLALAFLPNLLPLALVKPHIGLAAAARHMTPRRALACAAFGLLTLLIDPGWVGKWLAQIDSYDGFLPLRTLPGLLALVGILGACWLQPRRLLMPSLWQWLLVVAVPQRLWYDQLIIFGGTYRPRAMLLLVGGSWLGYLLTPQAGPAAVVACLYLPALCVVLIEGAPATAPASTPKRSPLPQRMFRQEVALAPQQVASDD